MQFLLIALVALLMLSSVFGWDPGPAPGVKLKNGILYLLALGLLLRASLDRNFKLELPAMPAAFATLIIYAVGSYLAIVLVIDYPRYNALSNALNLKALVDQMLFFLVFFYGVRTDRDALTVLKCLLFAFALSHITAVLDALGIMRIGDLEQRANGRVEGLVGEANQYGAFVAMTIPAMISVAVVTRGLQRTLWAAAASISAITLIMTVSRGAFVAVAVAGICGLVMFARYAPPGRLAAIAIGSLVAVVLVSAAAIGMGFGELLYARVVAESGGDLTSASSGRTEIWTDALAVMFEHPVSLVTGFGWRAYWTMPFRFSPHNHYLSQWFNLGLVGLTCTVILLVVPIRTARSALQSAVGPARPVLMAFVIATITIAVATFFVELVDPWLYFWAYAGIAMRFAVNAQSQVVDSVAVAEQATPGIRTDMYGWNGATRS